MKYCWYASLVLALSFASARGRTSAAQLTDTFTRWLDHPAIQYTTAEPTDPVARLGHELESGRVVLRSNGPSGYLRSLLDALNIPVESQIAVFVPDSVQARRINHDNPRTLFFTDNVIVGWVRGGFIEIAAQDRQTGVAFYSLDQPLIGFDHARITRRHDCLSCHYSYSTVGVPGVLSRSSGQFSVDHRIGLESRWGGWYVTGALGSNRHRGNTKIDDLYSTSTPTAHTSNLSAFEGQFDWTGYLTPHSDVVALMVFDHQMHMMNLLTRIGWEARVAAFEERTSGAQRILTSGEQTDQRVSMAAAAVEVVDYMLFIEEAPLAGSIRGSTAFATRFEDQGPRDRAGRSLRQFDVTNRLFRYPCSYMIYSDVFSALPDTAKMAIYNRLWVVLSGQDPSPRYARLSSQDRQDIIHILQDTKRDLPVSFLASRR